MHGPDFCDVVSTVSGVERVPQPATASLFCVLLCFVRDVWRDVVPALGPIDAARIALSSVTLVTCFPR